MKLMLKHQEIMLTQKDHNNKIMIIMVKEAMLVQEVMLVLEQVVHH